MQEQIQNYREKVDKKLIMRQVLFILIILILLVISTLNIAQGKVNLLLAISGFALAVIVGVILSRMFKIFWHEETGKVVSKLDTIGIIFLVTYISLEIGRKWIFEHWLSGATLNAFSLIILLGFLVGRFLGTSIEIKKILSQNQQISE